MSALLRRVPRSLSGSSAMQSTALLFLAAWSALALGVGASEYLKCFVPGECRDSQILDVSSQNDSQSCLHHCQGTRGCEWFTYYEDSKACAALSGCLDLNKTFCNGCISGQMECPEYMCGVQGKCFGAMEGVRKVNDTEECQAECAKRDECNWHSFVPGSKSCILTNDCPALDKTCTDCVASEKGCASTEVGVTPEDAAKLKEKEKNRSIVLFTSKGNADGNWKALSLDPDISLKGCKLPKGIPMAIKTDNVFVHTDTRGEIALLSDSKTDTYLLDKSSGSWTKGKPWDQKVAHKIFVELAPHRTWIIAGLKVGAHYRNSGVYTSGAFHKGWPYQGSKTYSFLYPCAVDLGDGNVLSMGGYLTRNSQPSKTKIWLRAVYLTNVKTGRRKVIANISPVHTFTSDVCGIYKNPTTGDKEVVIFGKTKTGSPFNLPFTFNLRTKKLGYQRVARASFGQFPRAFPYKNSFFIPGTIGNGKVRQNDLLLYSPETESGWTKLKENVLDKFHSLYTLGVVSKSMLEC